MFTQGVFGWAGEINVFKHALAANGFFANGERVSVDQSEASIFNCQQIRSLYLLLSANQKPVFVGEWGAGGSGRSWRVLQEDGGHEGKYFRGFCFILIFFLLKVAHNSPLRPWLRQLWLCALGARSEKHQCLQDLEIFIFEFFLVKHFCQHSAVQTKVLNC